MQFCACRSFFLSWEITSYTYFLSAESQNLEWAHIEKINWVFPGPPPLVPAPLLPLVHQAALEGCHLSRSERAEASAQLTTGPTALLLNDFIPPGSPSQFEPQPSPCSCHGLQGPCGAAPHRKPPPRPSLVPPLSRTNLNQMGLLKGCQMPGRKWYLLDNRFYVRCWFCSSTTYIFQGYLTEAFLYVFRNLHGSTAAG